LAINPDFRHVHGAVEVKKNFPASRLSWQIESFPIPTDALPLGRAFPGDERFNVSGVGQGNRLPGSIIKLQSFGLRLIRSKKFPLVAKRTGHWFRCFCLT
jgi:hypothetical protein